MHTQPTALEVAPRIAPFPYDEAAATSEALLRHYVAQAIAAYAMFRDALGDLSGRESRPDLGWLVTLAGTSTAAALALDCAREGEHLPGNVARRIWSLTPEAGSLNGDHEDWLFDRADQLGINPADLNRHLNAGDFQSPTAFGDPWAGATPEPAKVVARFLETPASRAVLDAVRAGNLPSLSVRASDPPAPLVRDRIAED